MFIIGILWAELLLPAPGIKCLLKNNNSEMVYIYYYGSFIFIVVYWLFGLLTVFTFPCWWYSGCPTQYDAIENHRRDVQNRMIDINAGRR